MIGRILREPLLHFLVLGGIVFLGFALVNQDPPDRPAQILVTAADISGIEQSFASAWRRPPTEEERAALIEAHIRQEVLVREAQALALDHGDAIIRQRLQQKMDFLLAASANAEAPSEADLQSFLQANPDRFQVRGSIAFDQVFLGERVDLQDVDAALEALNTGADPQTLGVQTLLPADVPLTAEVGIDSMFGPGFAAGLAELPVNEWAGPVLSGYGVHLVRVTERTAPRVPDLSEIRDRVETGWREARTEALVEDMYQELRARFDIQIEQPGS